MLGEILERIVGLKEDVYCSLQSNKRCGHYPIWIQKTFVLGDFRKEPVRRCSSVPDIAPTEDVKGQNSYLGSSFEGDDQTGKRILRGEVHDPTAFRMGGVAGHAGLFSTADDLARYCQMLVDGGVRTDGATGC